jgi:thioredoxin reductase (NADPH)
LWRTGCGAGFARNITASKVLLATGIVDEKPALPHLQEFIYEGAVRFCPICDGYEAAGKRIAVMGKLEHALEKALFLRTYSKEITLLALDDPLRLGAAQNQALKAAGISEPVALVADLIPKGDLIEATLANGTRIQADILYPAMGARVRSELATDLGARANRNGCLIVDEKQRTSVPDLYAAGDVTLELHQLTVSLAASDHKCAAFGAIALPMGRAVCRQKERSCARRWRGSELSCLASVGNVSTGRRSEQ